MNPKTNPKIEEIIKELESIYRALFVFRQKLKDGKQVEHCSEPKCPECNLVAYEAGRKKGREDTWDKLEKVLGGIIPEREENPLYHSQGKSCCFLNPCGCVCHSQPPVDKQE